jgi:2-polyprenyl-3-methyl-5-hydroxy-6-metoxy-1,4-benzoquinol methylase
VSVLSDQGEQHGESAARFARQSASYHFPYHWIVEDGERFRLTRVMSWGLEYLAVADACASFVRRRHPQRVLDVGCGDGRFARAVLAQCDCELVGVDPVEQAVAFANAFHHSDPRATFFAMSVQHLEDQHFDVATLVEVLEHIPDDLRPSVLAAVAERLRPGGALVVSVPTTNVATRPKHERHYDLPLLEQHLAPWFRLQEAVGVHRVGAASWAIERTMANRLVALLEPRLNRLLRDVYQRIAARAPIERAAHLVVLAERLDL